MKNVFLFVVAGVIFYGNLLAVPFIIEEGHARPILETKPVVMEDEQYVTIFDTKTPLGDCNFNVIRLYKVDVKPRFRKALPVRCVYSLEFLKDLDVLRISEEVAALALDYKKIVTDKKNKPYFYKTFSLEVDKYLFERLAIASTERTALPEEPRVWSIPGEIIYFDDDTKTPCEVEVGAFQYTLDADGKCSARCFVRYGRCRIVEDHHGDVHHFWSSYQHLDGTPVGNCLGCFLEQQKEFGYDIFSKLWDKGVRYLVQRYNSLVGVDFL